ncbi:MAG: hypothetical protein KUG79_05595 [Pseudomonadales bacterium]|nr:hypothetical protein [Pseudomonadales bacterium]
MVNGVIAADGAVTLSGGTDLDDTIDINANITAGAALTVQNAVGVDLANAIALQGSSVAAAATVTVINLSGTSANTITSTSGDVSLAAITDSADAALTVGSAGNTTLAAITLDAGGASAVSVTTDDNDDTAAAVLTVAGAISSDGTVTLAGGADNDELIDINANITAANALTITNGNVDLAAGVVLQGSQVVANATGNVGTINLSGTGTNSIISTAQQVDIAAVTDSADASLIVSSADNVILAAITLDDAGTTNGTLTVTADDDDNATASLMATGAISSDGAISLAGGADNNDTIDLDASVVSGGAFSAVNATEIDLAAGVGITGASVTANATITAIDLSGAGTNTITSTGGNVDLAAIGDSADASLVVSSSANVTLASILLDDAGTTNGAITINADDNDDTATATLSASGTIIADGAISLAGGTDNDDTIDLDGDVTAGGTLVVQNASTLDLAVNVDIQGTSVTASSNITAINLSGAGTNIVTSTAGAVDLAAVVDAAAANLTINSEAGVMLAGIVLDAGGAGVLDINLDTDGDGTDNLDVNGDISVNSITVDGSGTGNETVSLAANVDLTATTGGIAMATANNIGGIDLDGAGTNIITTGGDSDITLAALTDSAAANLTIVSEGSVTLAGATFDAGGAGAITVTTDSDDDAGAETIQLDGVITTTGAVALAGTSADDTIDLNAGITSTGAGITLSTVNAIRAADITLDAQGGDLTLGAAVSLDGTTGATFTTTNVDSDITIAAITSTANQNATVNSTGAATLGGAINLGTGNLIVSVDSDDDTGVTETLAVNNTVNAGAVTLSAGIANSRSNITQTAVITATSLTASATNGIALTQDNVVPTVILNNVAAGNIQYRSDAGGTLTVNGANTVSAGEITITEVNNGITVATAGLAADAGVIALTTLAAGQLITLNGAVASNQSTATGANITLTADDMDLAGTGGSINAGTGGTVALVQVTAADAIDLGAANDATANSLDLSSAELNGITADRLLIGADTSGAITISADVNISNVATTHLKTGATVTGTAGGIVANDLAINASGTVNITDSTTNVNNLAVSAAGFDVTFVEADGFEVDLVDTADAVTGITGANITLTTGGNLGLVRGINASGNVINSAVGNITQDAGIGVVTTNGSINYVAASDDNASGAIIMAADSNIETDGAVGSNISLIAGTATGGGNITLANVDAGADGNVTIQTFGGSIRDDGRDSSVITGDNISLTAAVDIGGATAFTVDDAKSAALEITRNGLSGISSTASGGNNQLIVVDSSTFVAGDFLTGLAGSGMSAGTEKQIFIGVLDGELQVNSSIDLSGTPGANNDLFLFTGGENNNVLVDAAVKLNRDLNDPVLQRLLTFQSSGNVEQTNNAVRLEAFEVEASAPNGSVKLFTSTDQLQSTGGENDSIFLDNVTPDQTEFKDEDGNSTTQLLADIVTGGTGTITIINSGSLTINKKVETTGTGDISITVSSPLFVTESISSGGNVTLVSQGADAADGVFILGDGNTRNGSIQTKSISGLDASITITSENKVVLDGSAVLSTLASGSNGQINLTAGNGGLAGSGAGDVTMASGARITAAGGAEIAVTAVGTIQLGELDAGLTGNSNVSITSTAGGISDGNGTDENIIGNNVTLTASGTIDTDLIVAGDLTADSSAGNGDINITSTFGGLSLQTVNAGTGVTGGDVALIVEKGGITDANVADVTNITGAVVVLNANGSINSDVEASSRIAARVQDETGAAKDGAITLRTQGDFNVDALAANSGTVKVTAGGQITDANGAAANIVAGIADLTANGGGIDLEVDVSEVVKATAAMAGEISLANTSAGSSLNVGNITTSGAVSLTSLGAISSTGGIISGTDLSLTAAGNIGSGRSFLGTDVNTVTATTTAGGTWINEADALTVTSINNTGITAITAGGDLTVTELTSTAAVGLVSAGTLTVTELATTGPVNMQAGGDLTVLDLTSTAAVGLVSAGSLTVTELETTGSVDIEAGDELTIGSINADGTVDIDAEGNVVVDQLVTTADVTLATPGSLSFMGTQAGAGSAVGIDTTGSVKLALGGDLIDGNTSGVATIAANTLSVSGGNNVGVASALVTEVSNIDLDVAEVNIMNTGDMVFNDSSIGGNLTLINTGSLALANLNVAGQAVSIVASAEVTDANGQLTNITAQSLDITAASVQDIETSISELTADIAFLSVANTGSLTISDSSATGAFDVINDGVLTAAGIDAASVSITSTGDILARNISASGSVLLSTAANIIDDNGAAVNITADSLVVTGRADINGLDTAVSNLSLRTGDADLTNTLALTLLDSSVTGDLKLSNSNQLTIQNIFVTGDASLSTLADNLVLGDLQIVGTLGLDSAANILDGNGARVNITAVLGAALAANGSIGTFADAIEVNAGDLSITRAGIDSVGVSANFAGNVNGGLVISSNIPGFVVFDPLGKGFRPVGGRAYNELAAALGAEQQMFEGGTGFNGLFQFERIVDSYYPTDNADMEIRYGDDVETQLIEIEDILTLPLSLLDFDLWIEAKTLKTASIMPIIDNNGV